MRPGYTLYLLLITLMHPLLGLAAAIGALVLVALGVLTDRLTRERSRADAALLARLDAHRREAGAQCRSDRRHGHDEHGGCALARAPRAVAAMRRRRTGATSSVARGARAHAAPGPAGRDARRWAPGWSSTCRRRRHHDRRDDSAFARIAAGRASDQRLARAGRRARRLAAARRAHRRRAGRAPASPCPRRADASMSSGCRTRSRRSRPALIRNVELLARAPARVSASSGRARPARPR